MKRAMYGWALLAMAAGLGCDDGGQDEPLPDAELAADGGDAPDADREPADVVPALMDAVDLTRYSADLEFVARGPRATGEAGHWQATQDHCAEVFLDAGLEVVRQPIGIAGGVNVIGVLPGVERPAEQIVLGAHYDSHHDCVGADDNGSGVAAVLEAARVLGEQRFERTLVFVCFDAEEPGLLGSKDFARRARAAGDDIRGAFILEMIGYVDERPGSQRVPDGLTSAFPDFGAALEARDSRGDFLFFVVDDDPEMLGHLRAAAERVELPLVGLQLDEALRTSPLFADLRRSDHAPLWDVGLPGMMLTDTANFRNPRYHCSLGEDDVDSVDLEFALATTRATIGAAAAAAGPTVGELTEGRERDPAPAAEREQPLCDVVAGTCTSGERCALLRGETLALGCVAPAAAPVGLDVLCTTAEGEAGDDCAAGLFCSPFGSSDGLPRCRSMCNTASDCPAGEICPDAGAVVSLCVPGCDPLGDDCLEGTFCRRVEDQAHLHWTTYCGSIGEQTEGQPCGQELCAAGLSCPSRLSQGYGLGCLAWCRVSAPDCGPGRTCRRWYEAGQPDDAGFCLPDDVVLD